MAIVFPLSLPTTPAIKSTVFRGVSQTPLNRSQFTGHQQITSFPGKWWEVDVALPTMVKTDMQTWRAFLLSLGGAGGTFLIGDPDHISPTGTGVGTPLVNGVGQTGQPLITDGWGASQVVLKAGDYIQIGTNLYTVLEDVTADVGGNATLLLFPQIRLAHDDGATIITTNTVGEFRLADPTISWSSDNNSLSTLTFSALEVI